MIMLQTTSNRVCAKMVTMAVLASVWAGPFVAQAHAASLTDTSIVKTWMMASDDAETEEERVFTIPVLPEQKKTLSTMKTTISAYSSAVNECDDSPFLTADGSVVRDGIVAANMLPLGTKFRIPDYFGDKVFEVRDRMNPRYHNRIDIWVENKKVAFQWGVKRNVTIEIIERGDGKKNWDQWKGRNKEMVMVGKYGPSVLEKKAEVEEAS